MDSKPLRGGTSQDVWAVVTLKTRHTAYGFEEGRRGSVLEKTSAWPLCKDDPCVVHEGLFKIKSSICSNEKVCDQLCLRVYALIRFRLL